MWGQLVLIPMFRGLAFLRLFYKHSQVYCIKDGLTVTPVVEARDSGNDGVIAVKIRFP